jgi:hypothetical protein
LSSVGLIGIRWRPATGSYADQGNGFRRTASRDNSGQAVAIVPAGAEAFRPDLTTMPLEGVEPSHVVLATRAADRNRLVAAFRKHAEAHLTRTPATPMDAPQ